MAIQQIIYRSIATHRVGAAELDRLVQQARIHNFSQNITGLLLFADRQFLQVLEGEPEVVAEMFAYISQDARHARVAVLVNEPAPRRLFPEWSLGFGFVNAAALARLTAYLHPRHRAALVSRTVKAQEIIPNLLHEFVAEQVAPRQLVCCR